MNQPHLWLLFLAVICIILSITLLNKEKEKAAILIQFLSGLFLRLFMAHLDPFFSDWDEKYHALVARNMMDNPLMPMLKTEILIPFDKNSWCCNSIWLHKQPLFLWQMALSMKIFGVSEFAARYPSALLGALMVPITYRIAKLYTENKLVAFSAALLMCCSGYQMELTSGYMGMDHNDVAFGFYVLASIWAYAEYTKSKKIYWVVLIGAFAGCAILNKWLTGLLVFGGWGINIVLNLRNQETRKEIFNFIVAFIVCTIVFVPWQLYILNAFPEEARYEYAYNTKHLFEAVEEHKGQMDYYLRWLPVYFGPTIWILVLAGLVYSIFKRSLNKKINITLSFSIISVYIFFSVIVVSKLSSYCFMVAPLGYIYMALILGMLLKIPKAGKPLFFAASFTCAVILLNPAEIYKHHNPESVYRQHKTYNTNVYKNAKHYLPADVNIVMNLPAMGDVEFMFYNPGINAFHYCYHEPDFDILKKRGIKVAIFRGRAGYNVPFYILNYDKTHVIDIDLKSPTDYYR